MQGDPKVGAGSRGVAAAGWWAVVCGLWLQGAGAQPAPAASAASAASAQTIEVRATNVADRRAAAAGQQVVDAAELARHGDARLADALRRVAGITVSGTGAELSIRLDGMAAEQTLILLNGEPVPRAQVLEALGVGQIERIEVVRGANVQWSGRGLAGSINIVTRQQASRAQRDMALTLGSHFGRPTGQAELTLGDRQGTTSWRLGLTARAERERYPADQQLRFADAGGGVISAYRVRMLEAARDDSLSITPLWQWAGDGGRRLLAEALLSASRFQGAGEDDRSEVQGDLPRMQHDRLSYRHDRVLARLRLEAAWPLTDHARLSANVTGTLARRDQASLLTGSDFNGVQVRDSTVDSTRKDDLLTGRLALEQRLGASHTLNAGLQLESKRGREGRLQQERIPSWEPDRVDENYDATARSTALYLQDDWLPDRSTTLSLGARIERLDLRSEGNVFDGVRQQHRLASPMVNLLWRPDAQTRWQLGLSRAYRLPEPRDIMPRRWTRPENSSLVPDFFGNPDLRPESAWTLQLNWDRNLGGAQDLRLGLGAVAKRIDDVVLRELVLLDDRYLLRPLNQGRAWTASLQVRVQADVAPPWGGANPLALKAAATARQSRVAALSGPDNRLPDQSPWELDLDAEQRFQAAGLAWTADAAWRWRAATRARAPGQRLLTRNAVRGLDLSISCQLGAAERLRLSVVGLGAGDEREGTLRTWDGGTDALTSSTQRALRWRLQWTRPL